MRAYSLSTPSRFPSVFLIIKQVFAETNRINFLLISSWYGTSLDNVRTACCNLCSTGQCINVLQMTSGDTGSRYWGERSIEWPSGCDWLYIGKRNASSVEGSIIDKLLVVRRHHRDSFCRISSPAQGTVLLDACCRTDLVCYVERNQSGTACQPIASWHRWNEQANLDLDPIVKWSHQSIGYSYNSAYDFKFANHIVAYFVEITLCPSKRFDRIRTTKFLPRLLIAYRTATRPTST